MQINTKKTSSEMASLASKTLKNKNSSVIAKSFAASALSQTSTTRQTSSEIEAKASAALKSDKYNCITKSLAASVLSQSNKSR
jgi:hypothetical protein